MKQKYILLTIVILNISIAVSGNNSIDINDLSNSFFTHSNLGEFEQTRVNIEELEQQNPTPKPVTKADLDANYKKQMKALKKWGEESIINAQDDFRDPIQRARVIEFDAKKSNIERFSKSPCWKKLGYNLYESYDIQDARYKACESKYYKNRTQKGLTYFLILVMIIVISLLLIKERKFLQPNSEV